MTAPEKAAPIPAEVRRQIKKLWVEHGGFQYGPRVEHYAITEDAFWQFMAAILADREARPSLPDSREERDRPAMPSEAVHEKGCSFAYSPTWICDCPRPMFRAARARLRSS